MHNPEEIEFLPNTISALKRFQDKNRLLFIVTNQSGIGRGYFSIDDYYRVQHRLDCLLKQHGIYIKETVFCPHTPKDRCWCRKPRPGLWFVLQQKYKLDPNETIVIGDKICDVLFGINSQIAYNALVLTGYGKEHKDIYGDIFIDFVAQDLLHLYEILQSYGYLI